MKTLKQFAMKRSRGFSEKSKIICSPNFLIERNLIHSNNLSPKDDSKNILSRYSLLDNTKKYSAYLHKHCAISNLFTSSKSFLYEWYKTDRNRNLLCSPMQ